MSVRRVTGSQQLADRASPDLGGDPGAILAIPVGSTEQHGAHMPLSTDTDIAVALCQALAQAVPAVLVAPAVAYGSSGEHAGFPGTISIGQAALELLMIELGRSAADTFAHLVFVCGHGGNAEPLGRAVRLLRSESRDVLLFQPRWQGDPHAGVTETSLMLALHPDLVEMQRAVPGDLRPLAETLPLLRTAGVRAVTPTGVLGDPTGASALAGHQLFERLVGQLVDDVQRWRDDG